MDNIAEFILVVKEMFYLYIFKTNSYRLYTYTDYTNIIHILIHLLLYQLFNWMWRPIQNYLRSIGRETFV
jgi:hypothetical protein